METDQIVEYIIMARVSDLTIPFNSFAAPIEWNGTPAMLASGRPVKINEENTRQFRRWWYVTDDIDTDTNETKPTKKVVGK